MKYGAFNDLYMADVGTVFIQDRRFVGAFGEMDIPQEVLSRGARLQLRGFYDSMYQYAARWCAYQLEKRWRG